MSASLIDSVLRGSRYAIAVYHREATVRLRFYLRDTGRTILFTSAGLHEGTEEALKEAVRIASRRGWKFDAHVLTACGVEVAA